MTPTASVVSARSVALAALLGTATAALGVACFQTVGTLCSSQVIQIPDGCPDQLLYDSPSYRVVSNDAPGFDNFTPFNCSITVRLSIPSGLPLAPCADGGTASPGGTGATASGTACGGGGGGET